VAQSSERSGARLARKCWSTCDGNSGTRSIGMRVPTHYPLAATLDHMVRSVALGIEPPTAPRIEITTFDSPSIVSRNGDLARIAVPIEINNGTKTDPRRLNPWGYSVPLPDATIKALCRNHGSYVSRVSNVTDENLAAQYILEVRCRRDH
jgi:hypothetical protein